MTPAFDRIAFTPSVKAAQARYGRPQHRTQADDDEDQGDRGNEVGEFEQSFIEARDGFYLATVSETGWPYVQYRGGPAGFLRVVDAKTLGFADFRGNVQYVSVGNLAADDRVALILLDYAHQQRLKIRGRARVVSGVDDPALVERLAVPGYRARIERAILVTVEALDWNCPRHITQRFTLAEVEAAMAPLRAELATLRAKVKSTPDGGVTGGAG